MPVQTRSLEGVAQVGSAAEPTWTSISQTQAQDGVPAIATFDGTGEPTKVLILRAASAFSLPGSAIVTKILARVRRRLDGLPGGVVRDRVVGLTLDGSPVPGTSDASRTGSVPYSWETVQYQWDTPSIAPAQVNAVGATPEDGFRLRLAYETVGLYFMHIQVDYAEMEVQYAEDSGVPPPPPPTYGTPPGVWIPDRLSVYPNFGLETP